MTWTEPMNAAFQHFLINCDLGLRGQCQGALRGKRRIKLRGQCQTAPHLILGLRGQCLAISPGAVFRSLKAVGHYFSTGFVGCLQIVGRDKRLNDGFSFRPRKWMALGDNHNGWPRLSRPRKCQLSRRPRKWTAEKMDDHAKRH